MKTDIVHVWSTNLVYVYREKIFGFIDQITILLLHDALFSVQTANYVFSSKKNQLKKSEIVSITAK